MSGGPSNPPKSSGKRSKKEEPEFKKPLPPPKAEKPQASSKDKKQKQQKSSSSSAKASQDNSTSSAEPKRIKLELFKSNYPPGYPSVARVPNDIHNYEVDDEEVYNLPEDKQPGPSNVQHTARPSYLTPRNTVDSIVDEADDDEESEDEEDEDDDDEEDVNSDGSIDEELAAVVERLTQKVGEQTLGPLYNMPKRRASPSRVNQPRTRQERLMTIPSETKTPKPSETVKVQPNLHFIYQLYYNDAHGYWLLNREDKFVVYRERIPEGMKDEIGEFLSDRRYEMLFKNFKESVKKTRDGSPVSMFDGRFVLVKRLVEKNGTVPLLFVRGTPRDPLYEPPILEEFVEKVGRMAPGTNVDHPKAFRWPLQYDYTLVEYGEDPFWTKHRVPIPERMFVPEPILAEGEEVPGEDFNWVRPEGEPPLYIPPEAWALREERKAEHFRKERERLEKEKEEQEKAEKEKKRKEKAEKRKEKRKMKKARRNGASS